MRWLPLFALAWSGAAAAQSPLTVSGTVRDASTGAVIPGADVRVGDRSTSTGADGAFTLGAVPAGRLRVLVRAPGYAPDIRWVDLVPGLDTRLAFDLTPRAWQLDSVTVHPDAPVLALTGDELEGRGRDLPRALDGWAGLVVRRTGSGGPAAPQFAGGAPDELLVLVDGFPANDPLTGRADLASLSTSDIARVTLEPGAQGAREGARAVTGVLRIETRREIPPEASITVGQHGAGAARLAAATGNATLMVRRESFADGFAYDVPEVRGGGETDRLNSDGSRWSLHAAWRGGFTAVARGTASNRGIPGIVTNPTPRATATDRSLFVGARGGRRVEVEGSFEWLRASARDVAPPTGPAYDATTEGFGIHGGVTVPHEASLAGWAGTARFTVEGRHDAYRGDGVRSGAAFDQGAVAWSGVLRRGRGAWWTLNPSIRVDWWTGSEPVVTGRIDAAWNRNGTMLTLGVGSAVTAPVLSDLFFREGVGVAVNPRLRPERVRWEAQAGAAHHGRALGMPVEGSLRLHYGRVDGMILWSPDFRFVWSPRNFDVKRGGGEVALRATPASRLSAGVSASWSAVTHVPSGHQVQYRPRTTFSADLAWSPGSWRANLRWHRIGSRYPNGAGQNPLPPISLVDAGLERRVTRYASIRADIHDLLDERATYIAGYPTPGRSVSLTLTVNLP